MTERKHLIERAKGRAQTLAFKTVGRLAPYCPAPIANAATDAVRRSMRRQMGNRRFMIERHMHRALGPNATQADIDAAVDEVWASYARYWIETFRLGGFSRERIESIFEIEDDGNFFDNVEKSGVILALPHLGQWEVAGAWVGIRGYQITSVAEVLEPREVFEWFLELREEKFGMNIIAASDPAVTHELESCVERGDVVCLLADRDLTKHGQKVVFFGEETTMPTGPAHLALETGAPLLPTAVYEIGDWRYRGVVLAPIEIPTEGDRSEKLQLITQRLADALETLIRRAPSQWHLIQPNWPSDREELQRRRRRAL